jgi:putative ABC transport system permease protein
MPERASIVAGARIGKQIQLPLGKAVQISLRSLKIRLGRAALTTGGVVLALAFLMSVWTNSALTESLWQNSTNPQTRLVLQKKVGGTDQAHKIRNRNAMLVVLSLVVCVTGVMNAMLMSVAERFREIGTMKCLGALDGLIIKLFLIESAFQGAIGAVVGCLIGFALATMSKWITFGFEVFQYFPTAQVLRAAALTVVVGVALTILGAVYPAHVAARMKPVDAMRVDQ